MIPAHGTRVRTTEPLGYLAESSGQAEIAPAGVEGVIAERSPEEHEGTFHVVIDAPGDPIDMEMIPLVCTEQIEVIG